MTKEEALRFKEGIEASYTRRIVAKVDEIYAGRGQWGVKLTLVREHRTATIWAQRHWESLLPVWKLLMGEEVQEPAQRERKGSYHLVDRMVMYIFPTRLGYWVGSRTIDKKVYKKYFGVEDPRGQYPACPKPVRANSREEAASEVR